MDNKTNKPTYEQLEALAAEQDALLLSYAKLAGNNAAKVQQLKALLEQLGAEAAQMKAIIDSVTDLGNEPQFHEQGMGCGLEDRGITNRYEAMSYGWDQAMERVYGEVIPCAEELAFPATDAYISQLRAEGVELAGEYLKQYAQGLHDDARLVLQDARELCHGYAAQLREGKAGEVCGD